MIYMFEDPDAQQLGERKRPQVENIEESAPYGMIDKNLWLYQLKSSDTIEKLEHNLRGEIFNDKEEAWEKRGKQLLNDEGIRMLVTIISTHLSKEKILTHIPEQQVNRMCLSMRLDIVYHLAMMWRAYEVSKADFDIIVDIVDHTVYTNLSRGTEGRTLAAMVPTIRRVETIREPEESRRKSVLGFLPFGGKH